MKNLLISGNTDEMVEWDLKEIVSSKKIDIERMLQYDWDNKISKQGWTYLEIEQFNNQYNNFK